MSKETELTNYEKALHIASVMPRFYIGQEVKTKDGNGIIVKLEMEWNGLYISPERSKAQIWFGTGSKTTKWISDTYSLKDLNVAQR
jgi:hypothetical protein